MSGTCTNSVDERGLDEAIFLGCSRVVQCLHELSSAQTTTIADARRAETVAHAHTQTKSPYAPATGFLFGATYSASFSETIRRLR
jgi:hypothetical protein